MSSNCYSTILLLLLAAPYWMACADGQDQIFTLDSWEASYADRMPEGRCAVLHLNFHLTRGVEMELRDETGYLLDRIELFADEEEGFLRLTRENIKPLNPLPGVYTLKVRSNGELVAPPQEFRFQGGSLELSRDDTEWEEACAGGLDNPLYTDPQCISSWEARLNFTLRNPGDLPIYIYRIENVKVDTGSWFLTKEDGEWAWEFDPQGEANCWDREVRKWILPGREEEISLKPDKPVDRYRIIDIPRDGENHTLTFDLQDSQKNVLISMELVSPS